MDKEHNTYTKYPIGYFDITGLSIKSSKDIIFTFEDDWTINNIFLDKIHELYKEYKELEKEVKENPDLIYTLNDLNEKIKRIKAVKSKMMKFFYLLNCEDKLYSYK